ncbi:MAG: EAL domain-containing protein [Acidisphaera sp.]|nr:EAL domain-containing protein [Acidisphaera sp.]
MDGASEGKGLRAIKLALGCIIAFFAVAAIYSSVLIVQRQHALQQVSRYNVTWLTSQAALELARLEQRVAAYKVAGSGVDQDEVQLRLDIVANRVRLLSAGEVEEFIKQNPELRATVVQLKAAVDRAQPLVDAIDQSGSVKQLIELLQPLDAKLAQLAAAANNAGGERVAQDQAELSWLHWIFSGILVGVIGCGVALIGLLAWHYRLLQRAHARLHGLASNLQTTSEELAEANRAVSAAYDDLQVQNRILKERDHELHTQNERFDAALNNMSQALCMVDAEQRLIVCNSRYLELFGLSAGVVRQGSLLADVFRAISAIGQYTGELLSSIYEEQQTLIREHQSGSFFQEDPEGRALAVAHEPMSGGGWVATYEDITERRRVEARISHMAHHDALTSLPNRVLFRERMEQALGKLHRQNDSLAVLCLDLDHFKDVNDTLGHPAGDALLEEVAKRLQDCVRDADVVARLGGDEFAILQSGATQPDHASALAQRIVETVGQAYELEGQRVIVTVSLGIAIAPMDGSSADQLLKNADMAMYRAKADGRGTYRFFEAEMDAQLQARRAIEMDLREALPHQQLEVFYQSLFNLGANRVSGFEALLRWRHPEKGMISPAQFIPVAEDIGLIGAIGAWVLHQACCEAVRWPDHVKVAVNLSPVQFRGQDLVGRVADALAASGLSPNRLELEITESVLLQDNEAVLATLHELRALGLRIALDDFGTGYSSLSYLRSFPFDKIKIDQSFVREMGKRPDCLAIVNSVSMLAWELGMTTTAEGVETEEQLRVLRTAGCTEVQGFFIDRPKPAADVMLMFGASAPVLELSG